ncbi:MAG: hypothetical protein ACYC6M_00225, partial [Terriglobales bacterium]
MLVVLPWLLFRAWFYLLSMTAVLHGGASRLHPAPGRSFRVEGAVTGAVLGNRQTVQSFRG